MEKPSFKLVGAPCGQHGQYTFYKALRLSGEKESIIAIGDFFFVRIWQDSELVSIGELQLLWTDRVSDQTLVSLRLYFLPENTPDGRNQHGEAPTEPNTSECSTSNNSQLLITLNDSDVSKLLQSPNDDAEDSELRQSLSNVTRKTFPQFDLDTLLQTSAGGNSILKYYATFGFLENSKRNQLTDIIIKHIYTYIVNCRITYEEYNLIAAKIITLFSKESIGTYFTKPIKKIDSVNGRSTIARGKLVDKVRNLLYKYGDRKRKSTDSENTPPSKKTYTKDVQGQGNRDVLWLNSNSEPWDEVIQKWKATFELRKEGEHKSVHEFLQNWRILADPRSDILDEVLAINEKVVLKAEDLLSWICSGEEWRYGLRAVWRGACAPPGAPAGSEGAGAAPKTDPLHQTKLDFSDVEKEKSAIEVDSRTPGVVVFSYPRYCRYRALVARLEGMQAAWLRDALVAALGGYAARTENTRILYCKDTFEYPELEGHEYVCNHLAPRLKGRPRGRRRRPPGRDHSPSPSSDSDAPPPRPVDPKTPRRLSLRNGAPDRQCEADGAPDSPEERRFAHQLRQFYQTRSEPVKLAHSLKDLSLRVLYESVTSRGGYEAVCRHKLWRAVHADRPARVRALYERFLLPFENHERRNGRTDRPNGRIEDLKPIDTIEVPDSPLREIPDTPEKPVKPEFRLRTPSPKPEDLKVKEVKEELNITSKPAEELNREFLESLPKEEKPLKITLKPVEKLLEPGPEKGINKLFEENSALVAELAAKHKVMDSNKVIDEVGSKQLSDGSSMFLSELAQRLNLGNADTTFLKEIAKAQQDLASSTLASLSTLGDKYAVNGHTPNGAEQKSTRPAGRSSLRHVRVKPTRPAHTAANTPPGAPLRPDSASSSPPAAPAAPAVTNFGIHHPPAPPAPPASNTNNSDDEIVEVPYKPKTPEIIDLDEYPESPQAQVKKKKLDILKERGLEVTAIPTAAWGTVPPPVPLSLGAINPPMMLNPAMQHQIMTQASLFQMYNIIPQNYSNGIQPPKVIQATCIYGNSGPEKTVYGNPKDPFMPPPHILTGTPVKPQKTVTQPQEHRVQDILDLTCKTVTTPSQKPAVEIVRIPSSPSPSKPTPQNLSSKNYTLIDGKAVVGSNLEITLVNPKVTPTKNRPPQKRSSNGKFVSTKTPTPPKEPPKPYPSPSSVKKNPIVVPNYQINRDDVSPTSSTGSRDSQSNFLQNAFKNPQGMPQIMDTQKSVPTMTPFMDPLYMSALYNSLAGQMDQRQLAMYREFMANQFRGYSGLLGAATPTTKN